MGDHFGDMWVSNFCLWEQKLTPFRIILVRKLFSFRGDLILNCALLEKGENL